MVLLEQNNEVICKLYENDSFFTNSALGVELVVKKVLENKSSKIIFDLNNIENVDTNFYTYLYIIHNHLLQKDNYTTFEIINANDNLKSIAETLKKPFPNFLINFK